MTIFNVLLSVSLFSVFLYAGSLCLLPSFLLPSFTQPLSPLLCGPELIILRPIRFTVMSPHLCLIVFPSQFLTQSIFNTFFLLELNRSSVSWLIFPPQPGFNLYQYFHSFPFLVPDVIAFDCRKTSTVPLPCDWK